MSEQEKLRMNAYYYSFDETGVIEIDRILSAVACAGKGYHHTDMWGEANEYMDGKSYIDLIQDAANAAAEKFKADKQ